MPLSNETVLELARSWVRNLDNDPQEDEKIGGAVVLVSFSQPSEVQWEFILEAVNAARSEASLRSIAAGPAEHLLGFHGEEFIDRFEETAARCPKFAHMLSGVWRHGMSDEVWKRIEEIKRNAPRRWSD